MICCCCCPPGDEVMPDVEASEERLCSEALSENGSTKSSGDATNSNWLSSKIDFNHILFRFFVIF